MLCARESAQRREGHDAAGWILAKGARATTRCLGRSKPRVRIRNKRLEEAKDAASQKEIYEASGRIRRAKTESASSELVPVRRSGTAFKNEGPDAHPASNFVRTANGMAPGVELWGPGGRGCSAGVANLQGWKPYELEATVTTLRVRSTYNVRSTYRPQGQTRNGAER
jgi:hypothetical protein